MPTHDVGFGRIAATVTVTDMPRARAFYEGVLGMTKTFENGNPVGFVILKRGEGAVSARRRPDRTARSLRRARARRLSPSGD